MTFNCPDATIDLTQLTSSKIELNFYFTKKASEMSNAMQDCYDSLREKFPILKSVFAVSQEECLQIPKAKMRNGTYIFIFDDFNQDNEAFSYICNANGVFIFGTRCLLTMLNEGIPTPLGLYHIHNLSMRNLIICPTGMNKESKKQLKKLVNFMGGNFLDILNDRVTHLVSDTVRSVKYETAARNGIKVMHADWVTTVWQKSQSAKSNIYAADEQFESFKLPVFFSLVVTTTGMNLQDRNMIKTYIEDNGGRYSPSFNGQVDILIMNADSIGSQKFKAAQKMGKLCLLPTWVTDSIAHGYSVADGPYRHEDPEKPKTRQIKASTPTKITNITVSKFNPDNTQLSEISRAPSLATDLSLCETNMSLRPSMSASSRASFRPSTSAPSNSDYVKAFENITLAAAKKVGNVLDGLSFHLTGFTIEESALLGKVLSSLGGTKIDHISDQVTHFIVGALDPKLFCLIENYHIDPVILKIGWLAKVIQEKKNVDEAEFLIERPGKPKIVNDKPSPASKKAMKSLSTTFKKPAIPKFQLEEVKRQDVEESVLSHYLENHMPEDDSNFNEAAKFLMGKYVYVHGFCDSSSGSIILQECERAGAALVDDTFHKEIDYIIAPSQIMPDLRHNIKKFKHIVSDRWLEESTSAGECVPVKFHHMPLYKLRPMEKPLKDEIFVVSNYKNMEREYIKALVRNLGGDCLEVLRRTESPIVISPDMTGAKCTSAKAWELAVLPVEWLLKCYETKTRVDESSFLLGGTKPTSRNIKRRESFVPSSQDLNYSKDRFDELDPPVENYGEDDGQKAGSSNSTPLRSTHNNSISTPDTPHNPLSASFLYKDMSTPRRIYIKKALEDGKKKKEAAQAISPRRKRIETILDTPNSRRPPNEEIDSPYEPIELPDCMKPTPIDYSLRPNSSPASQWFHKRKMEVLDTNYHGRSPPEKRPRNVQKADESIPHTNNRYDFFKAFLSPPQQIEGEVSKVLPPPEEEKRDETDDMEAFTEADEDFLLMQRMALEKPKRPLRYIQPDLGGSTQQSAPCYDSENLVEWRNNDEPSSSRRSSAARKQREETSLSNDTRIVPVFGINGLTDEIKKVTADRINGLGADVNEKDFTHLVIAKPNKSEKFLMALAKGLFVVHFEYVGRCESQATFLDESEFEMGNPKFSQQIVTDYDLDVTSSLFKAAYKWRIWITRERRRKFKNGAFTDMKFFVIASALKKAPIVNVIEAGGGRCFDVDQHENLDENLIKRENIKICLCEQDKMISPANLEIARRFKIKFFNIASVFSYLMREKVPEEF